MTYKGPVSFLKLEECVEPTCHEPLVAIERIEKRTTVGWNGLADSFYPQANDGEMTYKSTNVVACMAGHPFDSAEALNKLDKKREAE